MQRMQQKRNSAEIVCKCNLLVVKYCVYLWNWIRRIFSLVSTTVIKFMRLCFFSSIFFLSWLKCKESRRWCAYAMRCYVGGANVDVIFIGNVMSHSIKRVCLCVRGYFMQRRGNHTLCHPLDNTHTLDNKNLDVKLYIHNTFLFASAWKPFARASTILTNK